MIIHAKIKYIIILIILIFALLLLYGNNNTCEKFTNINSELYDYIQSLKKKENRIFPFRYFTDINNNILPFVAVTGFFRDKNAENKYYEYLNKGIR